MFSHRVKISLLCIVINDQGKYLVDIYCCHELVPFTFLLCTHSLLWEIATAIWNENCNCIAFQLHALSAASTVLVVKFEDLKTDLIGQVERMLDFVKFPYMEHKLKGRLATKIIKNAPEA